MAYPQLPTNADFDSIWNRMYEEYEDKKHGELNIDGSPFVMGIYLVVPSTCGLDKYRELHKRHAREFFDLMEDEEKAQLINALNKQESWVN